MPPPLRRRLPPLNWLRIFDAAARHMSFTGAAEELGVTQAAVSQQVKQLEDWLGIQLFKRLPRSLTLTDAGIAYLPQVRDALDRLGTATDQIFARHGKRAVTLRAATTVAALWLAPRLASFQDRHPDIALRLTTLYAPVDFGQDGVDIEIRYGAGTWPGVKALKLFAEAFLPVCSPGYRVAGKGPFGAPEDLQQHRLIHVLGEREDWGSYFQRLGLPAPAVADGLQFDSLLIAIQACAAGGGVMLGTAPLIDGLLTEGRLVDLFGERIPARHAHYLVVPDGGDAAPEITAVVNFLKPG